MPDLAVARNACAHSDAALLDRFCLTGDEAAFDAIVDRHGPMVLGVCRRLLGNNCDADDAFQATFLVLVRKARSVRRQTSFASWLYGVATRTALNARRAAARRRAAESESAIMEKVAPDATVAAAWNDLRPLLDEEIGRLPKKQRDVVVLCYLEGQSTDAAAGVVGCPRGTVLSRLAGARERLRQRLSRRGVILSASALATLLSPSLLAAAVPASLAAETTQAMVDGPSTAVRSLTEGVLRTMWLNKLKTVASISFMTCVLGVAGLFGMSTMAQGPNAGDTLQGEWTIEAAEEGGKQRDDDKGGVVTFKDGTMTAAVNGRSEISTFKTDPSKKPKHIDMLVDDAGKREVYKGIYEIEGDTLRLCIAHAGLDRPTEFKTKAGEEKIALVTLKRK